MIVLIHSYISEITIGDISYSITLSEYPVYSNVSFLFSRVISHITVPLFGLISGYLYFANATEKTITRQFFYRKTISRVKTILIPYILWNIIILLVYAVGQICLPGLMGGSRKLISDYSLTDYLNVFWAIDDGCPMCFQLWFIRDLFIVSLLAPVVCFFSKKFGAYLVLIIVLCFIFGWNLPIKTLDSSVISTFTVGAVLAIHNRELVLKKCVMLLLLCIYIILVVLLMCLFNVSGVEDTIYITFVRRFSVICGVTVFPSVMFGMINNHNQLFEKASFFLYASHAFILACVLRLTMKVMPVINDYTVLAIYVIVPISVVAFILFVYKLLTRYTPNFISLLSGGR